MVEEQGGCSAIRKLFINASSSKMDTVLYMLIVSRSDIFGTAFFTHEIIWLKVIGGTKMDNEYFVGWGTLALINAALAQGKNRSGFNWFLLSLVLGPLATFILLFVEKRQ